MGLLVLAPLLLPITLLLRFHAEGEVFYKQKRVGFKNRFFGIWKFATMMKNSPNMGTGSLTVRNDPRVTPMGKWLRMTKINELPQLLNVLEGTMSLVGPRPQMKVDFEVYPPHVQEHIYDQRPGITGIGSIVFRDEEKLMSASGVPVREFYARTIAPYKGELELWYNRRQSFWVDFMLLLLTAWVIVRPASELVWRVFPDLPERPSFLKITTA